MEPVGLFKATCQGMLVEVDAEFSRLVGASNVIGRPFTQVVYPGCEGAVQWFDGSGNTFAAFVSVDGTHRWLETTRMRGEGATWTGLVRDATAVREAREFTAALTSMVPVWGAIIQDGAVVYNDGGSGLSWLGQGGRVVDALAELMSPGDLQVFMEQTRLREAGPSASVQQRYRVTAGEAVRWYELWSSRIMFRGEPAVQIVGLDVTQTVEREERQRRRQKMEALWRLAGGVAHDFNNVLMVILSSTRFIEQDLRRLSGDFTSLRDDLKHISAAAMRAERLTEQLSAFSQRRPSNPSKLDVTTVVHEIQPTLRQFIGEDYAVELTRGAAYLPALIDGDQLEQILLALVTNARDAMPQGGRILIRTGACTIETDDQSGSDYVTLEVADSGVGISEAQLLSVFDPFFTTKEVGKGTGLGLSMVQGLVKGMSGSIRIESAVGSGTTVKIFFPRCASREPDDSSSGIDSDRSAGRVLVVEDEGAVQRVVTGILARGLFDTEIAGSAEAAMAMLRGGLVVDLVLADVVLPGMSGVEFEEILAEHWGHIPVALMTGYADVNLISEDRVGPLLYKPFEAKELLDLAVALAGDS